MTRDKGFIDDILAAADRLAEIVEAGRANYDANWLVRSAAERQVEIIGEAVANLSDELRTRRSDLPFRQARALRNIIAHDYGDIDHDLLWETMSTSVPQFAEALAAIPSRGEYQDDVR